MATYFFSRQPWALQRRLHIAPPHDAAALAAMVRAAELAAGSNR